MRVYHKKPVDLRTSVVFLYLLQTSKGWITEEADVVIGRLRESLLDAAHAWPSLAGVCRTEDMVAQCWERTAPGARGCLRRGPEAGGVPHWAGGVDDAHRVRRGVGRGELVLLAVSKSCAAGGPPVPQLGASS